MKQKQVTKCSGTPIHPNMDDDSLLCLVEAQMTHREHGQNFSQSVLIRRAVRHYSQHLKNCPDYDEELKETKRAAKGIL